MLEMLQSLSDKGFIEKMDDVKANLKTVSQHGIQAPLALAGCR